MFEDEKQSSNPESAEDIFASVASTVPNVAPPTKEGLATPAAPSSMRPQVPPPVYPPEGGGFPWKTIGIVMFVLVLIAAAVGVSYYALSSRVQVDEPIVDIPVTPPTATTPAQATPTEETPVEEEPTPSTEPAPTPATETQVDADRDKDGLTDVEEATYGTSPTNPDSDNDGLFDREEIQVYHTNPLDPDTDADTYVDGEEVKNGYNPNGPGKLLSVPDSSATPS